MQEKVVPIDRFTPREYQMPFVNAFEKRKFSRFLLVWARRAGKDVCAFNLVFRAAMRKTAVYFYILPSYTQCKKVIWDSINNDGQRFLDYIPKEAILRTNSQEQKITLVNGSIMQLIGSDNIDSIVGTNPAGAVFSEYALQSELAYQFLRPIFLANGGWMVFISCVSPDTLIIGSEGLQRIRDVSSSREEYSELNKPIYGINGFHNAEQFYYGGKQKTNIITLNSGYQLECTPVHPIWNGREWVKSGNLKVGDLIPIQYGQDIWGKGFDVLEHFHFPRRNCEYSELNLDFDSLEFFYLLGLIHSDGNYTRDQVCITNKKDPEIIEFLHKIGFKSRKDGIHHEFSSREFCSLLEYMKFKHTARKKEFPDIMFNCNKEQMRAFLQGIFDGDGCSASNKLKKGYVKLTSTCLPFIRDLQVVLLNFGIISHIRTEDKKPTKKVSVSSRIHNIEIYGYFAHIFYRDIGFRLERKQKNWANIPQSLREDTNSIVPIDLSKLTDYCLPKNIVTNPNFIGRRVIKKLNDRKPHDYLKQLLSEKLFYSPIKDIQSGENEVYDFVIPETHSFFSNGYLSHNTPRGHNHFFDLYNVAKDNPEDWFSSFLTVEDTGHIDVDLIQKEINEGVMSYDIARQEYYCDFSMGAHGSFYSKYIDIMRREDRIGDVLYDPKLKVHTAWDLGLNDPTVIIFFQIDRGNCVRIIDYYEKSNQSLTADIKYVKEKPYIYGKHIGPHDVRNREKSTNVTRWETAHSLGITFKVAPSIKEKVYIEDGIEAVRTLFSRIYIDRVRCGDLIRHLENYRQEYDEKNKRYKPKPVHDNHSHAADAMRYLATSLHLLKEGMTQKDIDMAKLRAKNSRQGKVLPKAFR